ncbi:hypothetical protein DPM19_25360 [Actinomadura craniellae]|uniref:Globin domain-containing protein n=1 Tax=Actinomadura craniellae TaxID=2231787 RepID=A0A365H0C8_9ACTN|nr:globin family protein [Actinomadura craniellae]RAY12468.1 hypothetical protein DPM19_25360 [Actinomadura craniellae]
MNPQLLKENFALVAGNGDDVAAYFYADLFERDPALRPMFPASMAKQHEMLLTALTQIVGLVDNVPDLVPYLQDLGRRHRGYGVTDDHYPVVGASLLATLRHFSGPEWDETLEQDWSAAYGVVADTMAAAGREG